ncbi:frataxin homolog, mitochondrial [Culex quinquefasciatus]|uniref:frataxin homolog, mitochondrial n=1 Tax=Culex quinquefasciatus TaxID=7176 RepID=UPI0018E3D3D8|nr:frataxin homolog, mitochondrial [Culex quinquefasciatus]
MSALVLFRSVRRITPQLWTRSSSCLTSRLQVPTQPHTVPECSPLHRQVTITNLRSVTTNPNDFIAASLIDSVTFEAVCSDTLESLCDYFEQLVEETSFLKAADVTYGDGVLTVNLGQPYGTYVINRQSPNRQIWLSSPTSGPKRYDFVPDKSTVNEGCWVYKHDGVSLHELLQEEMGAITKGEVQFLELPHSRRK